MGIDYNFSSKGRVALTGLEQIGSPGAQKLAWQKGTPGAPSQISYKNGGDVQSAPFALLVDTKVIVVEVTYVYQPTFSYFIGIFPTVTLLKVAQSVASGSGSFNPLPPV